MGMHYTGHRARLKERLLKSKKGTIADYELLEILLFFVKPRSDVKPLAKKLLNHFNCLSKVLNADSEDLLSIDGIGHSTAVLFRCVQEIIECTLNDTIKGSPVINNSKTLLQYLKSSIGSAHTEKVRILYLNKKYMLLTDDLVDEGTIDQTTIYIREVIKKAFAVGATALVLAHNHPSGNPQPSKADILLTQQLSQACVNVDIEIIDHLIVTVDNHFSFKSQGIL